MAKRNLAGVIFYWPPPIRPRAQADAKPALVRSEISSQLAQHTRSNTNEGIEFSRINRVLPGTLREAVFSKVGDVYDENILRRDLTALWSTYHLTDIQLKKERGAGPYFPNPAAQFSSTTFGNSAWSSPSASCTRNRRPSPVTWKPRLTPLPKPLAKRNSGAARPAFIPVACSSTGAAITVLPSPPSQYNSFPSPRHRGGIAETSHLPRRSGKPWM